MKNILRLLLPVLCLLTVACSGRSFDAFPPRNGPEFEEAFPDASVLVTTDDVREVRALLETVPLPETKEHHDRLLALLDGTDELSTEHVLLLTEAVARESDLGNSIVLLSSRNGAPFRWTRADDEYAHVIDELILAGAKKVRDPSPKNFGLLVSRTQTKQTVIALANACASMKHASDWDDGSPSDLEAILDASLIDAIKLELCIDALIPTGRLDGMRTDVAVRSMNFDSGRTQLLTADYARRSSLSSETLLGHVELMDFDSARIETVQRGAPLLSKVDGSQVLDLVKTANFDSARIEIAEALAGNSEFRDSPEVLAIVETAAFDSGRSKILSALAEGSFMKLDGDDLIAFANTAAFDSGRIDLLSMLRPYVGSPLSAGELKHLLQTCAFDSAREQVVELFVDDLRRLPSSAHEQILDCFAFSSGKKQARKILDW